MTQTYADWKLRVTAALSIGTVRELAEITGIPKSTIAERRLRPENTTLSELEAMALGGLLDLTIVRKRS